MSTEQENYHELIKKLRDERVDVETVYIGGQKPDTDTLETVIEDIIEVEPEYYVPQRFRQEPEKEVDRDAIVQEICEIADSACFAFEMDNAEPEIPVYSQEKHLTLTQEEGEVSEVVQHIDMGELIGLMQRNWKELKKLTLTEIRNAMINIYSDKDSVAVEAAVDTALHLIRAREKAA